MLGTLSVQADQLGVDTIIYTGDMDTLQLVKDHVLVKVAKRGISEVTEYNQAEVEARYGFPPLKLIDFKGLVGDKSDNIPGVPGIGEKTDCRLLAEYGDLETILAHVDELKLKDQKLLREATEQSRQSKFLATIVLDVPVQLDLDACRLTHVNSEKVLTLFRQLEFRTLVERVLALFHQLGITTSSDQASEARQADNATGEKKGRTITEAENQLYAPPTGVVPIISPPLPPVEALLN